MAPLQAALNFLEGTIATLHEAYQHTARKVGEVHCKAFAKYQRDKQTLGGMIDGTPNEAGEASPARIPKSVNIKFELQASSPGMESNERFQALRQESIAAVELYKQTQTKILIKKKQLDVEFSKQEALEALATGLLPLAKGHMVQTDQPNINPHMIVHTILVANSQALLAPLDSTIEEFRAAYLKAHGLAQLPDPEEAQQQQLQQQPRVQAPGPPPEAPQPQPQPQPPTLTGFYDLQGLAGLRAEDLDISQEHLNHVMDATGEGQIRAREIARDQLLLDHTKAVTYEMDMREHSELLAQRLQEHQQALAQHQQAVQRHQLALQQLPTPEAPAGTIPQLAKLEKLILHIFVTTLEQYTNQVAQNSRTLALKKLHKETFTKAATSEAAMEIDSEPASDQGQIKDLVKKMVEDQLKQVQKQIARATGKHVTQALNQKSNKKNNKSNNNSNQGKGNRRGPAQGGASKNKKKSPNTNTNVATNNNRPRSRSSTRDNNRGRSSSRQRSGAGRGRGTGGRAGGRGPATSRGNRGTSRGRSRSSSRGRKQNSNTRRSRSSKRSTRK